MSPRSQETFWDQRGGFGEEVMVDQCGAPERLGGMGVRMGGDGWVGEGGPT